MPGHAVELAGVVAGDLDGGRRDRRRDEAEHVVTVHERRLHIELGELELAVGPQVLVAQAAGDLVIAVHAAHHGELLEDLRTLGQGVERAGLLAGRHHEVAGTLRGGGDQHRSLNLDEPLRVHGRSDGPVDGGSRPEVALHPGLAQIDVAVAQAQRLVHVGALVEGERRGLGLRQHLHLAVVDLDLAGGQRRVGGALGPRPDGAGDADHVLRAQVAGAVHHALHDAAVVPQVDEGEVLAVLTASVHPAAQRHSPASVVRSETAAQVGAHGGGVHPSHAATPARAVPAANWQQYARIPSKTLPIPGKAARTVANWQRLVPETDSWAANSVLTQVMEPPLPRSLARPTPVRRPVPAAGRRRGACPAR